MRHLLALVSLPLLATAPLSVKVTQASVTWGSGVEPKGNLPPGRFQAEILLTGRKVPAHPVFRTWRVKVGDFPGLEKNRATFPSMKKAHRLDATATTRAGGTWVLQGAWPGAPEAEDRLLVEIRSGSRRLGWAISPLTEQLIPTGKSAEATPEDHR